MKNKKLSVVLVLMLVLALTLSFTACGGSQGGEEGGEASGEAAKNPAALQDGDWEHADENAEPVTCNLGIEGSGEEWTMEGSLAKLDYSDLESQKETLENNVKEALKKSDLDVFELYTEYEEDEGVTPEEAVDYGIDVGELLFTSGVEDDEMVGRVIEAGAYNNPQDGNFYQYTAYSTENFNSVEEIDIDAVQKLLHDACGITVDKDLLLEGLTAAYNRAAEYVAPEIPEVGEDEEAEDPEAPDTDEELPDDGSIVLDDEDDEVLEEGEDLDFEDYEYEDQYSCTLQQTVEFKGEGYTDRILFNITAQKADKEDVPGGAIIYLSAERDRAYEE